jgi:hypothetical protein
MQREQQAQGQAAGEAGAAEVAVEQIPCPGGNERTVATA